MVSEEGDLTKMWKSISSRLGEIYMIPFLEEHQEGSEREGRGGED